MEDEWSESLSMAEDRIAELEEALRLIFLDPFSSHGTRAFARETLGIEYIPFASPDEMLARHRAKA